MYFGFIEIATVVEQLEYSNETDCLTEVVVNFIVQASKGRASSLV